MTRFHVVVPTRPPRRAELPEFLTDVRPGGREPEHRPAARGAELGGLDGVFVPFDPGGHDPLILAPELLRASRYLQVTAEFHPAIATPVYAAKVSASLQRYAAGRLAWQMTVDLPAAVARAHGDFLEGDARYARADQFLTIARGVWNDSPFSYEEEYFQVLDGGLPGSRVPRPFPRVYLSGTSPRALELSARHADVHVLEAGEDPALVPEGVEAAVRLPFGLGAPGAEGRLVEEIARRRDQGVAEFVLVPSAPVADVYAFAQRVLPLVGKESESVG
ncbi:LLM class flavin-dependent oxidoreductase [Spirillospora sp. NPDC047279]|uniref:LLM class flavin-dependent oxidoreductase n=1 Tax=Spirillospora sp. NPDC047279 TaxID=3155478 RepID=UPI0033CA3D92